MQLTFMRSNLEEITEMVRLAISLGFDRIKGHHLWTHFSEIEQESLRNDIRFAYSWNRIVQQSNDIVEKYNQKSDKKVKLDNFFELDVNHLEDIAPDGECPFLGKEIWVDPGGRFNVCCAPDQQRKALGEFGNLNHQTIAEITDSEEYAHLVNNYREHALCKSCNMRRPCE
jgi:radical SAM protein with 4Fe4S-binding SPASM domain